MDTIDKQTSSEQQLLPYSHQVTCANARCTTLCAAVLAFNQGFVVWAINNFEGPVLDVLLHTGIRVLSADEPLGVKDSVLWVHGHLHATDWC